LPFLQENNDDLADDETEEFKIRSFAAMVKDSSCVGVPFWAPRLGGAAKVDAFDPFAVEKWPLIQSYALEGVGG